MDASLSSLQEAIKSEVGEERVWLLNEIAALTELAQEGASNFALRTSVGRVVCANAAVERAELMLLHVERLEQKKRNAAAAPPSLAEIKPPRQDKTPRKTRPKEAGE